MKPKLLIASGSLVLLATLALIMRSGNQPQAQSSDTDTAPLIAVSTQIISKQEIDIHEFLPGRTSAFEVAEIRPQISGIITERLFQEGSKVEQGQQLYQIDAAPYEAALQSAEADLSKAKANLKSIDAKAKRFKELIKIEAISQQDYDDVTAGLLQAQADIAIANAAVRTATINLDYTKVYAPISGHIGKSLVTKGTLVTQNQTGTLTTITRLDPIYVDMAVSSSELFRMRQLAGNDLKLSVELFLEGSDTPYPHKGEFQFADVTVDQTTSSVQLRSIFPNPDGLLLPGMFVRTKLNVTSIKGILVPQKATTRGADTRLSVWVVNKDNTVSRRLIKTSQTLKDSWLITEGISNNETIVIEGIQKLREGMKVQPSTSDEI